MNAPEKHKARKAAFVWDDPLLLNDQLSEEERMVRDSAQAFAQGNLLPRVTEAFRHEKSDPGVFREMGGLGLLGPTVPPRAYLRELAQRNASVTIRPASSRMRSRCARSRKLSA